ncbi:heterokaryon incompatibility protein-domain-containing protein [Lasiosphaeris hirsuta]|uniref:Heterokaryon incompatibility protein-domain-containing protein n=1 Tax=Lasiosphaeris hirsuta TaxID=260670 RepID=A0AA40DWV4_9PEZI|nr:heterokaryon incompatibility protein-domain-containing protein [Lasiosphaeris hirsuta]
MPPPEVEFDVATRWSFCSWCDEWEANGGIQGVGYLEPNSDAKFRSRRQDAWLQEFRDLLERQKNGEPGHGDGNLLSEDESGAAKLPPDLVFATQDDGETQTRSPSDQSKHAEALLDDLPHRRLTDVQEDASACFLCAKIWSAFVQWATQNFGSPGRLDLSTSRVEMAGLWPKRLPEEGESVDDYTGYTDDGIHGRLCFIQINITVRDPTVPRRWIGPSVTLQRSCEQPSRVADIFEGANAADDDPLTWPEAEPYTARRRPLTADPRLFRKWKALCDAAHDDGCRPGRLPIGSRPLESIRLVDVESMCLVETEHVEDVLWVALSYVWGTAPFRVLTSATLEELKQEGALGAPWIPATIADAITVTRGIGERYLWADSLCIVQDSDVDKMRFVPRMDAIYGRAVLTIINAAGDSALSGLPGVRPGTRFQQEEPFAIGAGHGSSNNTTTTKGEIGADGGVGSDGDRRMWLVQTYEPLRTNIEIIGDSRWFTRGWTFQEAILSRRWLIFTPEQVYWECRQATWREDACWELPLWHQKGQTIIYEPAFYEGAFQNLWDLSTVQSFDETYQCLVHSYVKRCLTRESDGLYAFSGVLRAMTQATGFEFLWGLPKIFLGVALTWPCCRVRPRRRAERCQIDVPVLRRDGEDGGSNGGSQSKTVEACFPSWAWVGWVGQVYFHEVFGHLDSEHASLEFYHIARNDMRAASDEDGRDSLVIQHIPQNQTFRHYRNDYGKPFKGTNPLWRQNTHATVSISDIPTALLVPETRFSLLIVWTSLAELVLELNVNEPRGKDERDKDEEKSYVLRTDDGLKLDVMWDQHPPPFNEHEQQEDESYWKRRVECIVIGRDSLERSRERGQLSVLIVKRHSSGGLSREGEVAIWEDDWNRLSNRRWELVFLI